MDAKIDILRVKDTNGSEYAVYPKTLIKCITNENGDNLENTLKQFIIDNADLVVGDDVATKTYVAEQIAGASHLVREIVTEIPTAETAEDNVIYMLKVDSASGNDMYQEYQLIDGEVVMVGDTSVDLTDYAKSEALDDYFKNTGGTLSGNLYLGTTLDTNTKVISMQNSKRVITQEVDVNGTYNLYDNTNDKAIIRSTVDGDVVFNGTANEAIKSTFDGNDNNIAETYATKGSVDNIQTTSRADLTTAGWYRIAEYATSETHALTGRWSNYCEIIIKRIFTNDDGETHKLELLTHNKSYQFNVLSSTSGVHLINKVRYTYETGKAYIEMYYTGTMGNYVTVDIAYPKDFSFCWKAITPTLTEETVDGVTITTTYDIPANASPVTDLDLVRFKGTEWLGTSILEKALNIEIGVTNYTMGGTHYTGDDLPDGNYLYSMATIFKRSDADISVVIWGYGNFLPIINNYSNGAWSDWKTLATTEDLANYLPLSANLIGEAPTSSNSQIITVSSGFDVGGVTIPQYSKGMVFTNNNEDAVLIATDDYGVTRTAFRNNGTWQNGRTLATTADLANYIPSIKYDSQSYISFDALDGGRLGFLGMHSLNTPVFIKTDGYTSYDLLHTGNKPTGSYTGNGDATARTIAVGGLGQAIEICSVRGIALVYGNSAIAIDHNGNAKWYSGGSNVNFEGNFGMWTTEEVFNADGVTYYYKVL